MVSIARQGLGYSPARGIETTARKLSVGEQFVSILASMRDEQAKVGWAPDLLGHVAYSVLVAETVETFLTFYSSCAGMAIFAVQTDSVPLAVITGTLAQWQTAICNAGGDSADRRVRKLCQDIHQEFRAVNIDVWEHKPKSTLPVLWK